MHNAIIQVRRNKHLILPGEDDWAFGQVLSIVMIASSLREILNFIRYFWKRYCTIPGVGVGGPNLNDPGRPMY